MIRRLRALALGATLLASPAVAAVPGINVLGGGVYKNLTAAATTTIKSGQGVVRGVCVNSAVADTITIYDNTSGSGTKIATLTVTTSTPLNCVDYNATFYTGLTIVKSGTSDTTVVFN